MEADRTGGTTLKVGPQVAYNPGTLVDLFRKGISVDPDGEAMRRRLDDGSWESFTRTEVAEMVRQREADRKRRAR